MGNTNWDDIWIALGMVFVILLGVAVLVGAVGGVWFLVTLN